MQKTVVRNPNQSSIRRNLLNIAGITVQGETIAPQNGDRLLGGYGVAWLNNQDAASQTTGQDNPLPECNCESGGGGGGGSGGGGGVQPSGNCEKKNISELKQVLDDYASQSFCDKEFPEVQFSTFIGYDKPPSDSTAKEIELRMLCSSDDCNSSPYGFILYERNTECTNLPYLNSCYKCILKFKILFFNTLEEAREKYQAERNRINQIRIDGGCLSISGDFQVQCSYSFTKKKCSDGYTCNSGANAYGVRESFSGMINGQLSYLFLGLTKIAAYNHMTNKEIEELVFDYLSRDYTCTVERME